MTEKFCYLSPARRGEARGRRSEATKTMEIQISKHLEILSRREKGLRASVPLFYYYMEKTDRLGKITAQKSNLGATFNVSERTISNWAHALVRAGVIKYKYSGLSMINPDVYFFGAESDDNQAKEIYARFKSDI